MKRAAPRRRGCAPRSCRWGGRRRRILRSSRWSRSFGRRGCRGRQPRPAGWPGSPARRREPRRSGRARPAPTDRRPASRAGRDRDGARRDRPGEHVEARDVVGRQREHPLARPAECRLARRRIRQHGVRTERDALGAPRRPAALNHECGPERHGARHILGARAIGRDQDRRPARKSGAQRVEHAGARPNDPQGARHRKPPPLSSATGRATSRGRASPGTRPDPRPPRRCRRRASSPRRRTAAGRRARRR